ncbi:BolA family transcriptional regulator [Leisingera aquaemixtae]|uniref:BolA family protein n=1 Tax=Leisingera aquaemixtae TaxID=1396826 RepID=UPI0021A409FE|nr:BolA family protein [Leisingera aquaemixtae]UWQ36116.1 BolA family transcriptional regulator [Leisingera aquaemixtae]
MNVKQEMEAALQAAFAPSALEVVNESHKHAGHAGDDGSGESHFAVRIRSEAFGGMSRVAQHRTVHKALGGIVPRIHALALDTGV